MPFVFLSILWAISIHTVTAFLYCGLGGRPFWNTELLAPRFLTTAFVAGPAFILLAMRVMRTQTGFRSPTPAFASGRLAIGDPHGTIVALGLSRHQHTK